METLKLRGPDMLRAIADRIEAHPEQYNQASWGRRTDCGTACCVAGWAAYLYLGDNVFDGNGQVRQYFSVWDLPRDLTARREPFGIGLVAGEILDLRADEYEPLFNANWLPDEDLTVPDALRAIADGASVHDVSLGTWDDGSDDE